MIIANWPDKCSECGCTEFYVSSRVKSTLLLPEQRKERYKQRRVRFTCRDDSCGNQWIVDLISVDPTIFTSPKFTPIAVVAQDLERAKDLVVLDEKGDGWKAYPLSDLVKRGSKRVELVTSMAAAANAAVENEIGADHKPAEEDSED